ncbi:MAG TPA: AraC family transcriptional regulator [Candidatus Acidoferrum sp.]|jgi:AraC-like DNA-binding protein|nr:AraC family transcriptional regulator [Candidatus Acidoferrum sp.]
MHHHDNRSGAEGLERSCGRPAAGWIAGAGPVGGVELLRAWFAGEAYAKHRHDTYAIGYTESGIQVFDYRGAARVSRPGQVVVLHPDAIHDGRAGTEDGFGYRIVYVEPSHISEAVRVICGKAHPLPFVREPVVTNARLARVVRDAFRSGLVPLAADTVVVDLAEGLLAAERPGAGSAGRHRVDGPAIERARQFLDAERTRVVHSSELEAITGMTRYEVARQFRLMLGTSPHRYLVGRRLELARQRMRGGRPLADVAYEAGFADQAHFTRTFKAALGLTPARYRALSARGAADGRAPS